MSKVLEFGEHETPISESFYPLEEIVIRPFDDGWYWVSSEEEYKGIYAFHAATQVPWQEEQEVFNSWSWGLEPGGLLHVVVPSFEWLCRMGLQPQQQQWVKALLMNANNHYTMPQLRIMMHRAGLDVMKAKTGKAQIELFDETLEIEQHYVVGAKP
jgi:predicted SAM-dependent methyltransferase